MTYETLTSERFPGPLDEQTFVTKTVEILAPHGFTAGNSIACVGVCRDELCRSLAGHVQRAAR